MYFNLLAAALPANVCFTYYHLALPSNQAVSYSMLQVRIKWLTLLSVYFILELSIVLVLGLLYICSTGFEIYSPSATILDGLCSPQSPIFILSLGW